MTGEGSPRNTGRASPRRCSEFRVKAGGQSGNTAAVRSRDSKHSRGGTLPASAAPAPDLFQHPQSRRGAGGGSRRRQKARGSRRPTREPRASHPPLNSQPQPRPRGLSPKSPHHGGLKNRGETLEEKSHKITKCIKTAPPGTAQNLQRERGESCSRSSLSAASTGRRVDQRQAACSRTSPPSVPTRPDAVPSGVGVFALGTGAEPCGSATPATAVCGPVAEEGAGALRLTSHPTRVSEQRPLWKVTCSSPRHSHQPRVHLSSRILAETPARLPPSSVLTSQRATAGHVVGAH